MSLDVEELQRTMQIHIGQLNQLNQRVNETVGAIKAVQQLISVAHEKMSNQHDEEKPQEEPTEYSDPSEDVPQ